MQLKDILESNDQIDMMKILKYKIDVEFYAKSLSAGHDIVQWVNQAGPNNEELQNYLYDRMGAFYAIFLRPLNKKLLNALLHDEELIVDEEEYGEFVKDVFKNNQILMNKWLRYGETIRNEI